MAKKGAGVDEEKRRESFEQLQRKESDRFRTGIQIERHREANRRTGNAVCSMSHGNRTVKETECTIKKERVWRRPRSSFAVD